MSDVDAIIERLRAWPTGHDVSLLDAAEAAVLAAVDARTAEIVKLLEDEADDSVWSPTTRSAIRAVAGLIARRFPNGGTNDG